MRILYLGNDKKSTTSRHRADAFVRLGHDVTIVSPEKAIAPYCSNRILGAIHYRMGYALLRAVVRKWVLAQVAGQKFDMCFVDSGELLSLEAVNDLHQFAPKIALFNHDDPTGPRDGNRFNTLKKALPGYDLCLVARSFNVDEFKRLGAPFVRRVFMSYDEIMHAAPSFSEHAPPEFDNDVVFIGRNMNGEGRDDFLMELIQAGIKPAIWGDNWQASKHWAKLRSYWKGGSLSGAHYVNALHHAQICLGMLSKGNRDEHTTRSMEIPYAGGLLCAERTPEHLNLYQEGQEAIFWASAQECAEQCKRLLASPELIRQIKNAGRARVLANKVGNEDLCRTAIIGLGLQP
jgi:spore maturation protein CgeB